MGALGYSLVMFLVGQIAGIPGKGTQLTFFTYTIFCAVNILLIFLCRRFRDITGCSMGAAVSRQAPCSESRTPSAAHCLYDVLCPGAGVVFLVLLYLFHQRSWGLQRAHGTMLSVGAFCEIPFLFIADRLSRKVGAKKILLILGILSGTRWLLTYLISTPQGQFGVQMLNCINMLNSVTVSITLSRLVAPQFKTTVQTLPVTFESVVSIIISSSPGRFLCRSGGYPAHVPDCGHRMLCCRHCVSRSAHSSTGSGASIPYRGKYQWILISPDRCIMQRGLSVTNRRRGPLRVLCMMHFNPNPILPIP